MIVGLPDVWGHALLGQLWFSSSALLLPATLSVVNTSFYTGAAAGLRALGVAQRSLRAQLYAAAAYLVGGVTGGALGGAVGSAWGAASATFVGAIVWWWYLRAGIRERREAESAPDVAEAGTDRQKKAEMRST
jgi:membrane associated rhomboid family serine protease